MTIPSDAEVIDVHGKTVIPGLVDAHIHFTWAPRPADAITNDAAIASFRAADLLNRCLMVGVTTVRDVASFGNVGIVARQAFLEGTLDGSRPIVCGQGVSSTGGHGTEGGTQGLVMEVDGPDGFRAGVRAQLKAGADFIGDLQEAPARRGEDGGRDRCGEREHERVPGTVLQGDGGVRRTRRNTNGDYRCGDKGGRRGV